MVEDISRVLLVVCGGYLALRLLAVVLRVRWARRAYPGPPLGPTPGIEPFIAPDKEHQDRCRGALVGLAIGDALGLPAEQLPRWLVRLRYGSDPAMRRGLVRVTRQAGDISDDTQLTISVARSIDPSGAYIHQRFLDELAVWRGYRIGAGRACSRAARNAARLGLRSADGEIEPGIDSQGNGAAMRIAPLAIARSRDDDPQRLVDEVSRNARATHTAEPAVAAAVLIARLYATALRAPAGSLRGEALASMLADLAHASGLVEPAVLEAADGLPVVDQLRAIGTSGHVRQSVPAALALIRRCELNLPAAMRAAIGAGGDTDSVCALVGGFVGAQLGLSGLPEAWVEKVQHRDYLIELADRLASPAPDDPGPGEVVEVEGDVARREVDAVVNAWNRNVIPAWLLLPQGVSKAIRKAGGREAIRRVSRRAPLPLGSATETAGFDLPARWVIHVAGIDLAWRGSERTTRLATRNVLSLARCLGARSVALPLIGSGSGGASADAARRVMLEQLREQTQHFDRLELVSYRRPARST